MYTPSIMGFFHIQIISINTFRWLMDSINSGAKCSFADYLIDKSQKIEPSSQNSIIESTASQHSKSQKFFSGLSVHVNFNSREKAALYSKIESFGGTKSFRLSSKTSHVVVNDFVILSIHFL